MATAQMANAMTSKALDELWMKERDTLSYVFTALENDKERASNLLLADKQTALAKWQENNAEDTAKNAAIFKLIFGGF
jgi:hypothetical protein